MGMQAVRGKDLRWKTSMRRELTALMEKLLACLGSLMVKFLQYFVVFVMFRMSYLFFFLYLQIFGKTDIENPFINLLLSILF